MNSINRSKASRKVAAELGNLTDHQQRIFAWVADKRGFLPGFGRNYSTPSGTLRDVKAVAKKGHLVVNKQGTYVVPDALKARIADYAAEFDAQRRIEDAARESALDARRYVVVAVNQATGESKTIGGIYTGPGGDVNARNAARSIDDAFNLGILHWDAEASVTKASVIELAS